MAKNSSAKTTSTRTPAPAFYEVVFHASPKVVRGFVSGLILGSGEDAQYWFHDDVGIEEDTEDSHLRRAAERLRLVPVSEVSVVVSANLAKLLRSLTKKINASGAAEISSIKRIKQAKVAVRYHTYAKHYDDEVQILLGDLPRGLKLTDRENTVKKDPKAKGVETYTSVHHYESDGGGILVGRFDLVLQARDRLIVHPLINCREIELITG